MLAMDGRLCLQGKTIRACTGRLFLTPKAIHARNGRLLLIPGAPSAVLLYNDLSNSACM